MTSMVIEWRGKGGTQEELSSVEEGRAKLIELGYDPDSFWEQPVVWGDHDAFQ